MTRPHPVPASSDAAVQRDHALSEIGNVLNELKFGTITLTVHDSRVVQMEVTEKKRFGS